MSFTPNIPVSGQTLGITRDPIRNNFLNYYNTMSTNHNAPDASGAGKHKFVEMPVQGTDPTTLAGEGGLFTKSLSSDPTKSILYYQRDANTTINQPVMPMAICTFILRNTNGAATLVNAFNVTSVTRTSTGVYAVSLAITLPFTSGVTEYGVLYGLQGAPSQNTTSFFTSSPTGSGFTINILRNTGVPVDDTGNRCTFSVIQ